MSKQKLIMHKRLASAKLSGERNETDNHITNECSKKYHCILHNFFYTYVSDQNLWSSIWEFFLWSWVYLSLPVYFCSNKWIQKLRLIFDVFIHPNSHVNRTVGEIAILGVRSIQHPGLLSKLNLSHSHD